MSVSAERPAVQAHVEMDKGQILVLLGRDDLCRATHAGYPIRLFSVTDYGVGFAHWGTVPA